MTNNMPIEQRFWIKVKKTETCWEWQSILNKYGYGVFCKGPHGPGSRYMAHRIAYELTYGAFDKALFVCHKCDNRRCVRPDHLFLGTQKDNMRDCCRKNRHGKEKMAKPFRVIAPDGSIIEGLNIRKFCRENSINYGNFQSMRAGRVPSCQGYKQAK